MKREMLLGENHEQHHSCSFSVLGDLQNPELLRDDLTSSCELFSVLKDVECVS